MNSHDGFRSLTDSLPQCIWTMDPDGTINYRNRFWLTYSGLPDAVTHDHHPDVIHPDDRPQVLAAWNTSKLSGEAFEVQCRMRRHDGVYRWHINRTLPVHDAQGKLTGWIAAATDIDDAKRVEETQRFLAGASSALASSLDIETTLSTFTRLAVPQMADWCAVDLLVAPGQVRRLAVAHVDASKVELAHELARRYPPDFNSTRGIPQVLRSGQPEVIAVITPELVAQLVSDPVLLQVIQKLGLTSSMIVPLKARDHVLGAISFVSAEAKRHFNATDLAVAMQLADRAALALDNAQLFQEERRATSAIRFLSTASAGLAASLDYERTLATIASVAVPEFADGCTVHTKGEDGRARLVAVKHQDPEVEHALSQLHSQFPEKLDEPDGYGAVMRSGKSLLTKGLSDELRVRAARTPLHLELLRRTSPASAIWVPLVVEGTAFGVLSLVRSAGSQKEYTERDVLVAEDVARRASVAIENSLHLEAALRERKRAEEASRVKDDFLATVSHELRTPLTSMLGWVQMLRSGALPGEKQGRALESIERGARSQARLIEDLLDVSRIIGGKLLLQVVPLDLVDIIQGAMDSIRPAAQAKDIRLSSQLAEDVGPFLGDPTRLQQIIWNLLSNAVKFSRTGGTVQVTLRRQDGSAELVVEDSGEGIPKQFLPHLFERFRQADASSTRRYGGLGLGLSIARYLVEMHGGTISAESEGEGTGARFRVHLPIAASREEVERRPPHGFDPAPLNDGSPDVAGLRVLVVDDEPDLLQLVALMLEQSGAKVFTAQSVSEAVACVQREKPDVLLTDIAMPVADGYALLRLVRALGPHEGGKTPAIAMTAYARAEDRTSALLHGFQMHLPKPIERAELLAVVLAVAGRNGL